MMSDQHSVPEGSAATPGSADADASRGYGLATRAIHVGSRPDPATGAVNIPIYASSTFAQDGVGGLRGGFEYARTGNPTRAALEASLAAVEDATFGRAFSSGMAATDCALRAVLRPGDHVGIPHRGGRGGAQCASDASTSLFVCV